MDSIITLDKPVARRRRWKHYLTRPWEIIGVIWRYHFWPRFSKAAVPLAGIWWRLASKPFLAYAPLTPRPERIQTLLVFLDEKHLDLLLENLWTLAKSWEALPKLVVVGDYGSQESLFRQALHWWPNPWEFIQYEQVERTFAGEGRHWIVDFGRHHIFGRKLAAILLSARRSPTLYSDSDILWTRSPDFLDRVEAHRPVLLGSTNPYASYCEEMIEGTALDLMKPPFVCAGLVYLFQWPWPETELREWVERAMNVPPHPLAEQTIFGHLVRRFGRYIADDDIALYTDDRDRFLPVTRHPKWSGRHYVTPVRYHFYRDALLLRWGVMSRRAA